MELQPHTLATLFEQLGLDSDEASIERFITAHALDRSIKLVDAPFWTPNQAKLLKDELLDDSDWAGAVDELNNRLHPNG